MWNAHHRWQELVAGRARRVMVIGLDCVPPHFAFEQYRAEMPNLHGLMARGTYGPMHSTVPPITVPAWSAMFSGRDPGELGLYGFQQPRPGVQYGRRLVSPADVQQPRVWHWLGEQGKRVAVLFVPPSYPPEPVNGVQVSCFMTPDAQSSYTYPPELQRELEQRFGAYLMDVEDVRSAEYTRLLQELHRMTEQHFAIAEHVWRTQQPDFMAMVAIGPDRFHHAFYEHMDPRHPRYAADGPLAGAGGEFYRLLDLQLGRLLACASSDTACVVVSDHGARPLLGGIAINEWLLRMGWLRLHRYPTTVTSFSQADVDWSRTVAYGEGGYCGRVRLNLKGREPEGIVPPGEQQAWVRRIAAALAEMRGPSGEPLSQRLVEPSAYREQRGQPPELQVFFDDLAYRAIASLGHGQVHVAGDERGPDGCNHAWHGIFVAAGAGISPRGAIDHCTVYDVARTVSGLMGVTPPAGLLGEDRR